MSQTARKLAMMDPLKTHPWLSGSNNPGPPAPATSWLLLSLDSAATFNRNFHDKVFYILLNQIDLILTMFAAGMGFPELNPFMRSLLSRPELMLLFKLGMPVAIAWLVPGQWLKPANFLLLAVLVWNLKELALRLAGS